MTTPVCCQQEGVFRDKEAGNEHFRTSRFADASEAYSKALAQMAMLTTPSDKAAAAAFVEEKAAILTNRGTAKLKMGDVAGCLQDCDAALAVAPQRVKTLFRRSQVTWRACGEPGGSWRGERGESLHNFQTCVTAWCVSRCGCLCGCGWVRARRRTRRLASFRKR